MLVPILEIFTKKISEEFKKQKVGKFAECEANSMHLCSLFKETKFPGVKSISTRLINIPYFGKKIQTWIAESALPIDFGDQECVTFRADYHVLMFARIELSNGEKRFLACESSICSPLFCIQFYLSTQSETLLELLVYRYYAGLLFFSKCKYDLGLKWRIMPKQKEKGEEKEEPCYESSVLEEEEQEKFKGFNPTRKCHLLKRPVFSSSQVESLFKPNCSKEWKVKEFGTIWMHFFWNQDNKVCKSIWDEILTNQPQEQEKEQQSRRGTNREGVILYAPFEFYPEANQTNPLSRKRKSHSLNSFEEEWKNRKGTERLRGFNLIEEPDIAFLSIATKKDDNIILSYVYGQVSKHLIIITFLAVDPQLEHTSLLIIQELLQFTFQSIRTLSDWPILLWLKKEDKESMQVIQNAVQAANLSITGRRGIFLMIQ